MGLRAMWTIIVPGLLVAATGVGAGDLATAAFTGGELGTAILWAVVLGAAMKWVVTEGLARWQLATGRTYLEGCVGELGRWSIELLLIYLLFWSMTVAVALMSACGAAAHALVPLPGSNPVQDKVIYGILHSVLGLILLRVSRFEAFERIMSACVGLMFVIALSVAIWLVGSWPEVLNGLVVPQIPRIGDGGSGWTIALIGGVGGTLTILGYGYWIAEAGRTETSALPSCRIDLACGYGVTALFGLSMVVIGASLGRLQGGGASLLVEIGALLRAEAGPIGPAVRLAFLLGAWAAVFSSLLGVWQAVPYLFADIWRLRRSQKLADRPDGAALRKSRAYRRFQVALALIPIVGLGLPFRDVQRVYATLGAWFVPLLALSLLWLNGVRLPRTAPRYGIGFMLILIGIVIFFLVGIVI